MNGIHANDFSEINATTDDIAYESKMISLVCDECYNILGRFKYTRLNTIKVSSDDLSLNTLSEIIGGFEPPWSITTYCQCCHKETKHVYIDSKIARAVQVFNRHGLKTLFSCESHDDKGTGITIPYIAFEDSLVWVDEAFGNSSLFELRHYDGTGPAKCGLYLNFDVVPVKAFIDNSWISELELIAECDKLKKNNTVIVDEWL